uniref:Uncharacterized protein n=1 Tax=Glossina palpalis gambiensis TaxID=67801 RepID=A0A1B0C3Y2_9MUSC
DHHQRWQPKRLIYKYVRSSQYYYRSQQVWSPETPHMYDNYKCC